MCLGLFSVRWVYSSLGTVDYGLNGVVAAAVASIAFFQGVLLVSTSRFYSFSIGKGNIDETNRWFNTALSVFVSLGTFSAIAGLLFSGWIVETALRLPSTRIGTGLQVFRASVLLMVATLVSAPFISMFRAKQDIVETSCWNLVETICSFALAYRLLRVKGDVWLVWGIGVVVIKLLFLAIQVTRAVVRYAECRVRLSQWFRMDKIKPFFSFASFALIGNAGTLLRGHGMSILLNIEFPPKNYPDVNASFSVGGTLASHTQEGGGNRAKTIRYSLAASKFGTMLVLLFLIPLAIELDVVLKLWLTHPPRFAVPMCFASMFMLVAEKLSFGALVAVTATGKIKGLQCSSGIVMLSAIPLAWIVLESGGGAVSACWVVSATTLICAILRLIWARLILGMSLRSWFRVVFLPVSIAAAIPFVIGYMVRNLFSLGPIGGIFAVSAATTVCWFICVFWVVLNADERGKLKRCLCMVSRKADIFLAKSTSERNFQ